MSRVARACVLVAAMASHAHAQLPPLPLPVPLPDPQPDPDRTRPPAPDPAQPASDLTAPDPAPADPAQPDATTAAPEPRPPQPSDEMITPSELPMEPSRMRSAYPRALVMRPLSLPRGGFEGLVRLGMGHEAYAEASLVYGEIGVAGRYSLGVAEFFAGAQLLAFDTEEVPMDVARPDVAAIERLYAGASHEIADETRLGVQVVVGNLGSDRQRYSPSIYIDHKVHLSRRSAIELEGGVDYNYQNEPSTNLFASFVWHRMAVDGSVAVQAQATPLLAFQVSATYVQYKYLEDYNLGFTAYRAQSYSARAVISVSDAVDVIPTLGISSTGPVDAKFVGLSIDGRWLP
jgi:hypothetical protein